MTELAGRLERVRALRGIGTLKEFHERVGADRWSYAAVRNYHLGVGKHAGKRVNRDAPLEYLLAVSKVFAISLEWLISEQGPITREEARGQAATEDESFFELVAGAFPSALSIEGASAGLRARLGEVFSAFHAANERRADLFVLDRPTPKESAEAFAEMLAGPLARWEPGPDALKDWATTPPKFYTTMAPERLHSFLDAQLLALSLGTPDGRDFALHVDIDGEETNGTND